MRFAALCLGGLTLITAGLKAQGPVNPATSRGLFLRLEAGALNPDDPMKVTMAFGGMFGWHFGRSAIGLQALVQSQNGNAGADLTRDARTLVLLTWELCGPAQRAA